MKEMKDVMLDLETMSSKSDATIVAIGAVKFGAEGCGDIFYRNVSLKSSQDAGLRIDADTVMWWLKQSAAAREQLENAQVPLKEALLAFSIWLGEDMRVWGNGADFDNVILSNAYEAVGIARPWKYNASRCYRTIKSMYPSVVLNRLGTHHNAVDDARSQAFHLIDIFKKMKGL